MFSSPHPQSKNLVERVRWLEGPASTPRTTLLVGFDPRTAFAVARSLHRRNVRVVIATLGDWETPIRSRAVAAYIRLPCSTETLSNFISELLRGVEAYQVDTLIPVTDRALAALAPHYEQLRNRVRFLGPTPEQTAVILNKTATADLACKLGIPLPATKVVAGLPGLLAIEDQLKFPVFLKPESKVPASLARVSPGPEVFCCENAKMLRERLRQLASVGGAKFLVQERVPGDDVGLAVVMRAGRAVSIFQYRALRMWPAAGGVCVASRSETVNTAMADCAIRLLQALSWEGVAELDFRHDRQTGHFALLEVNGRFWGSTAAAIAAGADMPWALWQLSICSLEKAKDYRSGQRVRWLEGDCRRLLEVAGMAWNGGAWAELAKEFGSFLWDFRPTVRGMYWSWRDPLPGFSSARTFAYWWCVARIHQASRGVRLPALALRPANSINRP